MRCWRLFFGQRHAAPPEPAAARQWRQPWPHTDASVQPCTSIARLGQALTQTPQPTQLAGVTTAFCTVCPSMLNGLQGDGVFVGADLDAVAAAVAQVGVHARHKRLQFDRHPGPAGRPLSPPRRRPRRWLPGCSSGPAPYRPARRPARPSRPGAAWDAPPAGSDPLPGRNLQQVDHVVHRVGQHAGRQHHQVNGHFQLLAPGQVVFHAHQQRTVIACRGRQHFGPLIAVEAQEAHPVRRPPRCR